jgi:hypothetical protein
VASTPFTHRAETFGFDTTRPWALHAVRLLFCVPRAYDPLVRSWERHYPGTIKILHRLQRMGFVAYQAPVVMDTATGDMAPQRSRRVDRHVTTRRGRMLLAEARDDIRVLEDAFPRTSARNLNGVFRLLRACELDGTHARYGLSMARAVAASGMPERSGRWWVRHLVDQRYLRVLPDRHADVREVIPAHWRATRAFARQLGEVFDAFDVDVSLRSELRLRRYRWLDDIDPARLGVSGATDFDHDVEAQRILAAVLRSPRCVMSGQITVEPHYALPVSHASEPHPFDPSAPHVVSYRPDAEIRERDGQVTWRGVVEYERYQARRDGWNHLERFVGFLHTKTFPYEPAVCRFVVDSPQRVASYVQLIEAFTDYLLRHPERSPRNRMLLAVTSAQIVKAAGDPLDPTNWHRISVPVSDAGERRPVIHDRDDSPYDQYFAREAGP